MASKMEANIWTQIWLQTPCSASLEDTAVPTIGKAPDLRLSYCERKEWNRPSESSSHNTQNSTYGSLGTRGL